MMSAQQRPDCEWKSSAGKQGERYNYLHEATRFCFRSAHLYYLEPSFLFLSLSPLLSLLSPSLLSILSAFFSSFHHCICCLPPSTTPPAFLVLFFVRFISGSLIRSSVKHLRPVLSMEAVYEQKTPTYMDSMENATFSSYVDTEFLAYPPSPTGFAVSSMNFPGPSSSPSIGFNSLNLTGMNEYAYSPSYTITSTPQRPYTPPDGASISPPVLSYNLSSGEMSDSMTSGRHSRGSGTNSPPHVSYAATVPRSQRFNPMAVVPPARTSGRRAAAPKRRSSRSNDDSDDDEDDFTPNLPANISPEVRRETIRRQRIESEQRRRDELRDGYARLKDTLPHSNQKASKVSLLDRAVTHVRHLETISHQLESKLREAQLEVKRLRDVNEKIALRGIPGVSPSSVPPTTF